MCSPTDEISAHFDSAAHYKCPPEETASRTLNGGLHNDEFVDPLQSNTFLRIGAGMWHKTVKGENLVFLKCFWPANETQAGSSIPYWTQSLLTAHIKGRPPPTASAESEVSYKVLQEYIFLHYIHESIGHKTWGKCDVGWRGVQNRENILA